MTTESKTPGIEPLADKAKLFEDGLRLARDGDLPGACELLERAHALDPEDRNIEVTLEVFRRRSEDRAEPMPDSLPPAGPTPDSEDEARMHPKVFDPELADSTEASEDIEQPDSEGDAEKLEAEEERPSLRARVGSSLARVVAKPKQAWSRLRSIKRPPKARLQVERDIPYHRDGKREHTLDIYRPDERPAEAPAILYFEALGFKNGLSAVRHPLSAFAQRGWIAVHVRYRTIPRYPFPASLLDCARAYEWFIDRASSLGSNPHRVVVAGDTTGANLALALTLACCDLRDEVWAQRLFDLGIPPRALLLCSSYLQASDPDRFERLDPNVGKHALRPLRDFQARYLDFDPRLPEGTRELADPLLLLERDHPLSRPLPPCFAAVGTDDVFMDDTRRLEVAYQTREDICSARYVEGAIAGKLSSAWSHADAPWIEEAFGFLESHT